MHFFINTVTRKIVQLGFEKVHCYSGWPCMCWVQQCYEQQNKEQSLPICRINMSGVKFMCARKKNETYHGALVYFFLECSEPAFVNWAPLYWCSVLLFVLLVSVYKSKQHEKEECFSASRSCLCGYSNNWRHASSLALKMTVHTGRAP